MTTVLTAIHVFTAILFLGPVIVSTSMFPKQATEARGGDAEATGRASILYKITRTYGLLSLLVPVMGAVVLVAGWEYYRTNFFLHTAIVLALITWGILFFAIIPQQRKMMGALSAVDQTEEERLEFASTFEGAKAKATAFAGIFNLLTLSILILMYLPSSIFE